MLRGEARPPLTSVQQTLQVGAVARDLNPRLEAALDLEDAAIAGDSFRVGHPVAFASALEWLLPPLIKLSLLRLMTRSQPRRAPCARNFSFVP